MRLAAFLVLSLITVLFPFTFHRVLFLVGFIALWGWLIVPLWPSIPVSGKWLLALCSYPGTFTLGSWPVSFLPGILVFPLDLWSPAPFRSEAARKVGNIKGYESVYPVEMYSLGAWALLLGFLIAGGIFIGRTKK